MNEQGIIDEWKQDAERLARLLKIAVPALSMIALAGSKGVATRNPAQMQEVVNLANQALGVHAALVDLLKEEGKP